MLISLVKIRVLFLILDMPWLKRFDLEDEFKITEKLEKPETEDHIVKVKGWEVRIKTGHWITLAKPDTRLYFTQGGILPILSETGWGEVYWDRE